MKLFLDDVRSVDLVYPNSDSREWVIVRNYHQFINYIVKYGLPEYISFDHDLADISYNPEKGQEMFILHEKTGYDAAKWLVDYCAEKNQPLPLWHVHSQNPIGAKNITTYLKNAEKHLGINI